VSGSTAWLGGASETRARVDTAASRSLEQIRRDSCFIALPPHGVVRQGQERAKWCGL